MIRKFNTLIILILTPMLFSCADSVSIKSGANEPTTPDHTIYLGNGTFSAGASITTSLGGYAYDVKTGDFNGDGKADIIASNGGVNQVSLFLGNGDGTFGPKTDFTVTGTESYMISVADFNADNKLDFAVTNFQGNLDVFIGDGLGGFAAAVNYIVGGASYGLIAADVDNDNDIDLIAAKNFFMENGYRVFINDGSGAFGAFTDFATADRNISITAADFNGDNKVDIGAVSAGNEIEIHLGDGAGNFAYSSTLVRSGTYAEFVRTADLNGDGNLDIVTANCDGAGDKVDVFNGIGDGSFAAVVSYSIGGCGGGIQIGDYNGDDKQDIAVTVYNDNQVKILFNDGDGLFENVTPTYVIATNRPWGLVSFDSNGDLKLDLLFTDYTTNTVNFYTGN